MNAIIVISDGYEEIDETILGAVLLHEILHWDDYVMTRSVYDDPLDEGAIKDELRGHAIEATALDRVTDGGWGRAIAKVLSDPSLFSRWPGPIGMLEPNEAGRAVMNNALGRPSKTRIDLRTRTETFMMHLTLAEGRNEDERVAIYKRIRKGAERQDIRTATPK
jgi:hypothetical protein